MMSCKVVFAFGLLPIILGFVAGNAHATNTVVMNGDDHIIMIHKDDDDDDDSNKPKYYCNCLDCDKNTWENTMAGGYSCGDRITWLVNNGKQRMPPITSELQACQVVGQDEYPVECGACNPVTCTHVTTTSTTTRSKTQSTNTLPKQQQQQQQQQQKQERQALFSGPTTPTTTSGSSSKPLLCGCKECTWDVWNTITDINGNTCGERITWLLLEMGMNEMDACRQVSEVEFPQYCMGCNPDACNDNHNHNNKHNNNPSHLVVQEITPVMM